MAEAERAGKRSPQLAPLSREHHEGLLLVWRIYQGMKNDVDPGRIYQYILWYWQNHIKPHFFLEEKILLPYLPAGHELALRMQKDHEQIRKMILDLSKHSDKSLFIELANFIDEHIRFEEQELYGFLEQILSKDQLDIIFLRLGEHPSSGSEWTDDFWIKVR